MGGLRLKRLKEKPKRLMSSNQNFANSGIENKRPVAKRQYREPRSWPGQRRTKYRGLINIKQLAVKANGQVKRRLTGDK